ncbi:hypothetical protein RhiirC2_867523 [Rhizophagus irregularis]|uniref:Uncharacterized protein n=1 Tax=Rhizophagus irregularis TaxID=588596 RepID=A0A2N1N266_9GLOM|nr:hypothetical protein RhiirC2_867523 [Rhizophagus irregularis]
MASTSFDQVNFLLEHGQKWKVFSLKQLMSQFKKESSKKTVQKKDRTQTNTLCSHERSDIQGTYSTISTNFGLQHIALQPAPQFPFGLYGVICACTTITNTILLSYIWTEILKRKCSDSMRNVTKQKKVEVIEVEDDIDNEEVSDLPSIDFLLHCLDLYVAKDPTVREIIAGHFFVVPQGLEAFVEIYNDDELSDSEIASSMELIPRTKPFNDEEKVLQVAGYRLPPIFFTSANKFPYSERTLAIPPDVLYCQTNDKYYTQDEIAEYLKNSDHNYDWIINELINELHALYIRVRNLDNNKVMLQDFVKIMLPSIAEYIHIIDKLVVHVRKLFIDWRNKLWVALLNKYKELGNSYNKSLRKLSAIQIANMMSVEDIRKIWKQWRCNIDEAALEAAMESLRDVCAMGFRAIDVEESLNKAHDRFLCLYNDLFTVNLSITTRYNIATSMDLSVYYFEEFKRKSSKKNSLF